MHVAREGLSVLDPQEHSATLTGPSTSPAPRGPSARGAHRLAIGLMLVSSAGFSLNGLIVRSLEEATPWQLIFWRGLGVAASQLIILSWMYRGSLPLEFLRIGRLGVLASVLNGCSPAGFFFALTQTTVANVVFLLSTMPFVSALLARVILGERRLLTRCLR